MRLKEKDDMIDQAGIMMAQGLGTQSDREGDPYGIRWSVPQLHNGTTGYGNQSPSPETS